MAPPVAVISLVLPVSSEIQSWQMNLGSPATFSSSYSDADREWAETLATNLHNAGLEVFFAPWAIAPGDKWVRELSDGLAQARHGVVVISRSSPTRSWVKDEAERLQRKAVEQSARLIPVLLDDVQLPPFLSDYQAVDFHATARTSSVRATGKGADRCDRRRLEQAAVAPAGQKSSSPPAAAGSRFGVRPADCTTPPPASGGTPLRPRGRSCRCCTRPGRVPRRMSSPGSPGAASAKTALVAKLAAQLAERDFDGADYFDWSFYSQGTRDPQHSLGGCLRGRGAAPLRRRSDRGQQPQWLG